MSAIEAHLLPEEDVLWEGRPHGTPPLREALIPYIIWLGIGVLMIVFGWLSMRGLPAWSWKLGIGTIEFSGSDPTRGITSSRASLPSPFAFVAVVLASELWRVAAWRSRRYVVTPRRVLVGRGVVRGRVASHPRRGGETAAFAGGRVFVDGLAGDSVALDGLDATDAEAIRHALATFYPTPLPPPPTPWWTRRRIAAIVLLALAGLVVWGAVDFGRPVAVTASWKMGGGVWDLGVLVDSPAWGERAPSGFSVEHVLLDGVDLLDWRAWEGRKRPTAGTSAGMSGGLLRSLRNEHLYVTPGNATRVRIEGKIRFLPDRAVPFAVELAPGETVTMEPVSR